MVFVKQLKVGSPSVDVSVIESQHPRYHQLMEPRNRLHNLLIKPFQPPASRQCLAQSLIGGHIDPCKKIPLGAEFQANHTTISPLSGRR